MNQYVSEVDRCCCVADATERGGITFTKSRKGFADDLEFPFEDDLQILLVEVLISRKAGGPLPHVVGSRENIGKEPRHITRRHTGESVSR